MHRSTTISALALLASAAALCGCAAYDAYRKCGTRGCSGDAQITREVEAQLDEHPQLLAPNLVYVQTLDGVVYLSGQVATELQREEAVLAARGAPGARRVVDNIALPYTGR